MQETTNYGLHKPDYADTADIAVLNENADTIDEALQLLENNQQSHFGNAVIHVTAADKQSWNAKETPSGAQGKLTAHNADKAAHAAAGFAKAADVYTKTQTLTDATRGLYGLGAGAVPDEVFKEVAKKSHDSLLRDLNIMMNLSLGTSNMDAWADLLVDASKINAGLSSGYYLNSGQLTSPNREVRIGVSQFGNAMGFGSTGSAKAGQFFTATTTGRIEEIKSIYVHRGNNATVADFIRLSVYEEDMVTLIEMSPTQIPGASLPGAAQNTDYSSAFLFDNLQVVQGKRYFIVASRTGALSSGYYEWRYSSSGGGNSFFHNGTVWVATSVNNPLSFTFYLLIIPTAVVIWNPVTATEAIHFGTVTADLTLGTGWAKFYLSQDGVTWVEVSPLNSAAPTNFTSANVYLKCVMFGDAVVRAVAWGGY